MRSLALAYLETKQPEDALPLLRQVVRVDPSPERVRELGVALLEARRADEAELVLKVAVIGRPDFGAAYVDLGRAQAARGDLEAALTSLRKGIELDPKDGEGHLALARLQARRKQPDAAWRHAREAERLGHPGAQALLAELARESKEPPREDRKAPPAKKADPGRTR
jgi:Tfp pilus assembly protein PilF